MPWYGSADSEWEIEKPLVTMQVNLGVYLIKYFYNSRNIVDIILY